MKGKLVVDHIGYLCRDIHKSIGIFEQLGFMQSSPIYTDNISEGGGMARNVYICFLISSNTRIELVSPIDEESDVFATLKRQGEGPYHICYKVNDLDYAIKDLKALGWMVLRKPTQAIAFNNAKVAFLFRNGIGLIEIVESEEKENATSRVSG